MALEIDLYEAWEGQEITRRAQVRKENRNLALTAEVLSIKAEVFELGSATPDVPIKTEMLVPESVMYDTPQTETGWKKDKIGYNAKWTFDRTFFPRGGRVYQVEVTYNLVAQAFVSQDTPAPDVFRVKTRGRLG